MLNSAGLAWYKTGKVAVTNGSTTVTGTDTAWTSAGLKTGDIFTIDDQRFYEVASVNSNTSITLVKAYGGTTASNQSYGIIRNFAATVPSELAADLTELFRVHKTTIDETLKKIQGLKGDPGLYYKGYWASGTTYEAMDTVVYNNKLYVAKVNHVSSTDNAPAATNTAWQDMALSFPKGVDVFNYNNAGLHNSIFRGKNLGSSFTSAQSEAIKAGSFDDLWIGDFWEAKNVAYTYVDANGNTQNATYSGYLRIAHFNYFTFDVTHSFDPNHIVVIPEYGLFSRKMMDASNSITGGYAGSDFRTKSDGLARAIAIFKAFFGADHVLMHKEYLVNAQTNGVPSAIAEYDSEGELMNELMVYGSYIFNSGSSTGVYMSARNELGFTQFQIFRLFPRFAFLHNAWLRDICSANHFAKRDPSGRPEHNYADLSLPIQPYTTIN